MPKNHEVKLALAKKMVDDIPDEEFIKILQSTPACGPTAQEFGDQLKANIQTIIHASFHRFARGLSVQVPSTLVMFIVHLPESPHPIFHGMITSTIQDKEVQLLIVYDDGDYSVLAGTEEPKVISKDICLTAVLDDTLVYLRDVEVLAK